MEEQKGPEEDFEVTELDDGDLEDVAGGRVTVDEEPNNCDCNNNCGCGAE